MPEEKHFKHPKEIRKFLAQKQREYRQRKKLKLEGALEEARR